MRVVPLAIFLALCHAEPIVELPNLGKVEGWQTTMNGRRVYRFEGIPYAQPPVGENRFEAPKPVEPWHGVWKPDASYKCMQYIQHPLPGQDYVIGQENCLYLTIYTTHVNASFDVVVYIHSGAFMTGYGSFYQPDYFIDKNIVFVNLNYRLGPLGFLSTEDDVVPGNNGLKDQILALKFIKKYIQHFGGTPDSITLFGDGTSVNFHYLSPQSRGLFHRGWSMSGTMLVPWALMEQPLAQTKKLATIVGCGTDETMIKCLKSRPARQIALTVPRYQAWWYLPFAQFGPVIDSWATQPVLPTHPYQIIKNQQVYDVPWIASFTKSEGLYHLDEVYNNQLLTRLDDNWNKYIPAILYYNYTVDRDLQDEVSQKIRKYYLGEKKLSKKTFRELVTMFSDRIFINDIVKTAKLMAKSMKSPTYVLKFEYRSMNSWFEHETESGRNFGAAHGDDVPYIFNMGLFDTSRNHRDRAMVKIFVDLLTSFSDSSIPKVKEIEWPQVPKNATDNLTYLRIGAPSDVTVETSIRSTASFWDSLPIKENEKLP
uniref:Putative esterase n=1 Tax=Tribolium castaneum TaxID=7070 RepID=Q5WM37_TRICA|nr:putative esterase [Tribolium castaneum]